jgi:DNA repair protein RadA/Sms
MAKVKPFFCQNCGAQYAKWGQCNSCKRMEYYCRGNYPKEEGLKKEPTEGRNKNAQRH